MKNIVQVVEVTPTPDGQWITFWHIGAKLRVSGEFKTKSYVTAFDRGDVYVSLELSDSMLSLVGPHTIDLLKAKELSELPIVPDQKNYPRHDRYSRFDLDRETATLLAVDLSECFMKSLDGKTPAETLEVIASLH